MSDHALDAILYATASGPHYVQIIPLSARVRLAQRNMTDNLIGGLWFVQEKQLNGTWDAVMARHSPSRAGYFFVSVGRRTAMEAMTAYNGHMLAEDRHYEQANSPEKPYDGLACSSLPAPDDPHPADGDRGDPAGLCPQPHRQGPPAAREGAGEPRPGPQDRTPSGPDSVRSRVRRWIRALQGT